MLMPYVNKDAGYLFFFLRNILCMEMVRHHLCANAKERIRLRSFKFVSTQRNQSFPYRSEYISDVNPRDASTISGYGASTTLRKPI